MKPPERLVWSDEEFSIGIRLLDEQHKWLVKIVNGLQDLVESPSLPRELQLKGIHEALEKLRFYAAKHFVTEEEYMRVFEYAGDDVDKQLVEHEAFTNRVAKWRCAADETSPEDLVRFLNLWLYQHISWKDKNLGTYLNEMGLR